MRPNAAVVWHSGDNRAIGRISTGLCLSFSRPRFRAPEGILPLKSQNRNYSLIKIFNHIDHTEEGMTPTRVSVQNAR